MTTTANQETAPISWKHLNKYIQNEPNKNNTKIYLKKIKVVSMTKFNFFPSF